MPDDERFLVVGLTAGFAALPPSHNTLAHKPWSHSASQPEGGPRLHDLQAPGSSATPAIAPIACLSVRAHGCKALSEAWNVPTVTNAVSAPRIKPPTPTSASRVSHRPSAPVTSADPKPHSRTHRYATAGGKCHRRRSFAAGKGGGDRVRQAAGTCTVHPLWRCFMVHVQSAVYRAAQHSQRAQQAMRLSEMQGKAAGGIAARALVQARAVRFGLGAWRYPAFWPLLRKFWLYRLRV